MGGSGLSWVGLGGSLATWIGKQQTSETLLPATGSTERDKNEMPRFDDYFGSQFLKAEDLNGREVTVIIASVESLDMKDGQRKLALHFDGKKKALLLNKTNATKIASGYSQDFDAWRGKKVVLYPDETTFNGQMVPCLLGRVPQLAKNEPGDDSPVDW
jgi:hypothetical protein